MESKELNDEPFSVPLLATPTKGKKRTLTHEASTSPGLSSSMSTSNKKRTFVVNPQSLSVQSH